MTSLTNDKPTRPPYNHLEWYTEPTTWEDTIQVRESYAEAASGFLIGNHVWLDEYSARKDHRAWWDTHLRFEYDRYTDWEDPDNFPENSIRFLIHPGGHFEVRDPNLRISDGETLAHVDMLANFLEVPDDARLVWRVSKAEDIEQRVWMGDFYRRFGNSHRRYRP